MTAGVATPQQAKPYVWDESRRPPQETLQLWTDVGNGLDKSQTGRLRSGGHFRRDAVISWVVAASIFLAYSVPE